MQETCPIIAAFLGCMGVAFSIIFAICGAALGTAKSGVAIMQSGLNSPDINAEALRVKCKHETVKEICAPLPTAPP